jgi:hypothetical protein
MKNVAESLEPLAKMHSVKKMLSVQHGIHTEILMEKTTLLSGIISITNGWL